MSGPTEGMQQRRATSRRGTVRVAVFLGVVAMVAALLCAYYSPSAAASWGDDDGATYTLVLLRHGESQWNKENRFTGWVDVDVSEKGASEAANAGKLMAEANITLDMAFTSYQKRAIKTCNLALEAMDHVWIPVEKAWQLNERMYGNLQGANKAEMTEKYGSEKVTAWRRSYAVPPPEIDDDHEYHPKKEAKYASIPKKQLPLTESLALTIKRVLPYWKRSIAPKIKQGKRILIAAHGNSLRALVKYLDNIPEETIIGINIPTGVPLVYRLNRALKPVKLPDHAEGLSGVYLGDPEWVNGKIHGVANQAKR